MKPITHAARQLLRHPGLSLVAVLTLALGIGATTALFSVVQGVLLSPYPYTSPEGIWAPGHRTATAAQRMRPYRLSEVEAMGRLDAVAAVMATAPGGALLTGEFAPENVTAVRLTGSAFDFLGVAPVLGRTLQPSDIGPDGAAQPVAVLSFSRWQRLFGGDPAVLGRTLVLDDVPHTIVGVMPPRFGWWTSDGVWLPLGRAAGDAMAFPIVRLREGTSATAAEQELHGLHVRLAAGNPNGFPRDEFATTLTNYLDITVASGTMRTSLQLLFAAVLFLLLIACANVANLQLARVSSRAREVALRLALGAGRREIVRQLLTESVLLATVGGVAGLAFAYGITQLMVALMPPSFVPNEARIAIDTRALLFSLGVSAATGIVFGLVPALQASRADLTQVLNDEARGSAGAAGSRLRYGLVIAEVAISMILLGGAAVTLRSLTALSQQELGFQPSQVVTMQVPLAVRRYPTAEARNRFALTLLERLARLPGVEAATIGNGGLPFGGPSSGYAIAGQPAADDRRVRLQLAGHDYLRVMRVPLRRGRMLTDRDVLAADRVAVINEAAAALWPAGVDPIGRSIALDVLVPPARSPVLAAGTPAREVTVVGVVADARNDGLQAESQPAVLVPFTLLAPPSRTIAIRTTGASAAIVNEVRAVVREIDPLQPIAQPLSVDEVLAMQTAQPRFLVALFGLFGALGVGLAVAGLYGVLAHMVARRTREIGIRMALGAQRADVLRLVAGAGGRLVAAGLALGVAGAVGTSSLIIRVLGLFGVQANDPLTYAAAGALLAAVGLAATLVPAWHASRIAPIDAMR